MTRPLTPKQSRFVDEYLLDLNATQAAIRAGYSEDSAGDIGAQLLGKPHIREAIEAGKAKRAQETQVNAAWLLKRLADEATADVADLYDEATGALKPIHQWPSIWRQGLVAGIDTVEERDHEGNPMGIVRKVRLSDRVRRLELIGKHIGVKAFEETINVKGLDALADRLERAKARRLGKGD